MVFLGGWLSDVPLSYVYPSDGTHSGSNEDSSAAG